MFIKVHRIIMILLSIIVMLLGARLVAAAGSAPVNYVMSLTIKYIDPITNKQVTLKTKSTDRLKSFKVPAGVNLTLIFKPQNIGGNPGGDGIATDVWLDWPRRRRPTDLDDEDMACVPEDPSDCRSFTKKLKADLSYKGKQGKGIYNIVAWVDRFDTVTEDDEDDNYLGPVKIVVVPTIKTGKKSLILKRPPTTEKTLQIKRLGR